MLSRNDAKNLVRDSIAERLRQIVEIHQIIPELIDNYLDRRVYETAREEKSTITIEHVVYRIKQMLGNEILPITVQSFYEIIETNTITLLTNADYKYSLHSVFYDGYKDFDITVSW